MDTPAAAPPAMEPPAGGRDRSPSPPGTILAAGLMIGLAIGEIGFSVVRDPGRLLPHGSWNRLTLFLWGRGVLSLVIDLAMLGGGVLLLLRARRWTPWALVIVLARGVVWITGALLGELMIGGLSGPREAHGAAGLADRLSFAVWSTLLPAGLLLGAWLAWRRRAGLAPSPAEGTPRSLPAAGMRRAPWRAILMAVEGSLACAFVGLATYMAAVVPRSMRGLAEDAPPPFRADAGVGGEGAPQDAARDAALAAADAAGRPGAEGAGAEGGDEGEDLLPEVDPVLFHNRLDAVSGGTLPVWEPGGNATLVDFWASWCPPCLEELPHLQALHEKIAARGYRIVLINVDLVDRESTGRFLERKGIHLDSLVDRDAVLFQAIGLEALPSTFVLDREGRPVRFIEGGAGIEELEAALLRANEEHVRRTFR